ncbi:MAG: hypothetical protein KDA28_04005 [Phycisphaerales bacterium]|nr:hypothetical protein [Phycisphaerales bacterium]
MGRILAILLLVVTIGRADDALDLVAQVPGDADVVCVIERAGMQRESRAGRALLGFLEDAGLFTETASAWGDLVDVLGMTEREAFDRLFGRRVAFVVRDLERDDPHWAIISDIDDATRKQLLTSLRAVPRETIGDQHVYAIEHGRYALSIRRRASGARLLFAPARSGVLTRTLIPVLANESAPSSFGLEPAFVAVRGLPRSDVLLVTRLGPDRHLAGASLTLEADGWRADVVLHGMQRTLPVRPWSTAPFDRLRDDAALLIMGYALDGAEFSGQGFGFPLAADGQQSLMRITARPLPEIKVQGLPIVACDVAMTFATYTDDLEATTALGDHAMATVASEWSGGGAVESFGGAFPEAVRTAPVREARDESVRRLFGADPLLSWAYWRIPSTRAGWWVVNVATGDACTPEARAATVRETGRALASDDGTARALLNLGVVRPPPLAPMLRSGGFNAIPTRSLAWIEEIEWRLHQDADAARGTFRVRMADR